MYILFIKWKKSHSDYQLILIKDHWAKKVPSEQYVKQPTSVFKSCIGVGKSETDNTTITDWHTTVVDN